MIILFIASPATGQNSNDLWRALPAGWQGAARRSLPDAGNVLELDMDGGHTAVYIRRNSSSKLGYVRIILCKPYLNKVLLKNKNNSRSPGRHRNS